MTTLTKLTRADYMEHRCTHREYYSAIARTAGVSFMQGGVTTAERLLVAGASRSKDEYYNDIPLPTWDSYALAAQRAISAAMKQHGDFFSLAGGVCVMKEAVRQAVEAGLPKD